MDCVKVLRKLPVLRCLELPVYGKLINELPKLVILGSIKLGAF